MRSRLATCGRRPRRSASGSSLRNQDHAQRASKRFREELEDTGVAAALAKYARTVRGLTAPTLIIEAIKAASQPFADGMAVEARLAEKSLSARESHALRHLFFAERAASKVAGIPNEREMPPIRRAAIVGAGTMGSGIALAFADAGIGVTLIDSTEAGLARGKEAIQSKLRRQRHARQDYTRSRQGASPAY